MPGNSIVTDDQSIGFTDNMSFDGTKRTGKLASDGQIWMGSSAGNADAPNFTSRPVRVGSLVSSDGSVDIAYSDIGNTQGQIDLTVAAANDAILKLKTQDGNEVPPTAGIVNVSGGTLTAGTTPVVTSGVIGTSTVTTKVQLSQALAATDATKVGLSNFDSAKFTVDGNAFVSTNGSGVGSTITGNTGGALSPTAGNWNIVTDDSTVVFAGAGSTLTQDFGISNLLLGAEGTSITSAANNVGVGLNALLALSSGQENCAFGVNCLDSLNSGSNNCGFGTATLAGLTSSVSNTCFGHNTGQLITTGSGANVAVGYQALSQVLTGASNTAVGYQAGRAYTSTEANNICIGNGVLGTVAESGVTRIGANQSACYIDGIDGVNVGSVATVVTESGDRLGTAVITAGAGITITPGANTITIAAEDGGFTWSDASGAFSPLKNNGYFITATATGTLPASPAEGDTIKFFVDHATQDLTIDAPGTQIIRMGAAVTSAGGTAVSTAQGDSVELVYRASNTCWCAVCGFSGTWILS